MTADAEKPKIIVDEDWKAQVQAEKEAAKAGHAAPAESAVQAESTVKDQPAAGAAAASVADQSKSEAADLPEMDLPPASLIFLCTTLATQTMIALGQVPNPITGKAELRLKQAKHYIDTLGMLEEKTAGNRTADESALFDDLLHQLRMAYVQLNI